MMQAAKDRTRHHMAMCRPSMPLLLQGRRQPRTRLGHTRPQGQRRATCVVMAYPLREDAPHMVCREGNQVIHAFPPQRADEPLAEGIGLRSPHRRLEHPQPQVVDALVKLLREDAIAVMYQALEEAKGCCDHHTEITGHNGLGMIAHKGLPALGRRTFPSPRVQALGPILAYGTR